MFNFQVRHRYQLEVRENGQLRTVSGVFSGFTDNGDGTYTQRFTSEGHQLRISDATIKSSIDKGPA